MRSVDCVFITGALTLRWLGQYATLDKTFYSFLVKQEVVTAPDTSTSTHSSRRPFFDYNIIIILWIHYTVTIIISISNNNAMINNYYGRLQKLYFALQKKKKPHGHAKELLRNLQTIWARALQKFRQLCTNLCVCVCLCARASCFTFWKRWLIFTKFLSSPGTEVP